MGAANAQGGDQVKKSLLHVPMREAQKRIAAGEELTAADRIELAKMDDGASEAVKDGKAKFKQRIRQIAPWFDFTNYAYARLCGALSQAYPGEPLSSWMDIPLNELQGYIDAIPSEQAKPKPSRRQPEKDVTKWVRKNWKYHRFNMRETVRQYISIYGGTLSQLYDITLKNDLKKKPLVKPKKTS